MKAWRALLTKHIEDGRRLVREGLAGPLRFIPKGTDEPLELTVRTMNRVMDEMERILTAKGQR